MLPSLVLLALLAGAETTPARPPNVVFILADDLGFGDLGVFGNRVIRTPNIDRIGREGMVLRAHYAAFAVCSPSRGALLTGRSPERLGLQSVLWPRSKNGLAESERTIAAILKDAGYATACIGKWHLGDHPPLLPRQHGFELFFGIPYSGNMKPTVLMRDDAVIETAPPGEESAFIVSLTERYTSEAVAFIKAHRGRPFFLYLSPSLPHEPAIPSARFRGVSAGGAYGDTIEELDTRVGEVLGAIHEAGLDAETLVVFASDNGSPHDAANQPLRGKKAFYFEGGIRIPCVVRWPGRIPAGTSDESPTSLMDWLPTLVRIAGAPVPRDRPLDGIDIGPLLLQGQRPPPRDLFWGLNAMRSGDWKLVRSVEGRQRRTLLFNLASDVSEQRDVTSEHPEIAARLLKLMEDRQRETQPPKPRKRRR